MTLDYKKYLLALMLLLMASIAKAGLLGDMTSMFMSNSTAAGTLQTQDRVGVFGGSISMRTPVTSVNLIGYDSPRLSMGCSGVDLYGGSFSFLSAQRLIALFRQIAANSEGLIFKAAIQAIAPSLDKLLGEFQSLMQSLNNLGKNSCFLAHQLLDKGEQALGISMDGAGNSAGVINSFFQDGINAIDTAQTNLNGFLNKTGQVNPNAGNQFVKALTQSGASSILGYVGMENYNGQSDNSSDPNSLNNQLLVTMIGYHIAGIPCATGNTSQMVPDTPPGANNLGRVECNGPALLTLKEIKEGGGQGSTQPQATLSLYSCDNTSGYGTPDGGTDPQICTKMITNNWTYQGVQGWVNLMLFGAADPTSADVPTPDSIIGKVSQQAKSSDANSQSGANTSGAITFTAEQIAFMQNLDIPLLRLLALANAPADKLTVGKRMAEHIGDCVTAKFGDAIFKTLRLTLKDNTYHLTKEQEKAAENLRQDYQFYARSCSNQIGHLQIMQTLNESAKLTGTNF